MHMKWILTALMAGLLFSACDKKGLICCVLPPVEMVRAQTQCADPWGYGSNSDQTIAKLTAYLSKKNITVSKPDLLRTGAASTCLACTCGTGFTFDIFTEPRYIDSLKNEGFAVK
jgi:hypothetical protein